MSNQIHDIIADAIDYVNQQLPEDRQLRKSPETPLYGMDSFLDSFDLVTLIVRIEQQLFDRLGLTLTLANEKALSMRQSPFRTIEALENYVRERVEEASTHV